MNIVNFYKLLRQRANRYGFRLKRNGEIREKKTGYCPICAVAAELRLLKGRNNLEYDLVAEDINMSPELASEIVCCADSNSNFNSSIRRKLKEITE